MTHEKQISCRRVFAILGHEIVDSSGTLSDTGQQRCLLLDSFLKRTMMDKEDMIVFLGLGRMQGECKKSIAQCMLDSSIYAKRTKASCIVDERSLDTVGDAVFLGLLLQKHEIKEASIYIVTSDWHAKRCFQIFRRVLSDSFRLEILTTSETASLKADTRDALIKKESDSLAVFNKSFPPGSIEKDPLKALTSYHPLYQEYT